MQRATKEKREVSMKKFLLQMFCVLFVFCLFEVEKMERVRPNLWETDLKLAPLLNEPICESIFLFGVTRIYLTNQGRRQFRNQKYLLFRIDVGIPEKVEDEKSP